MGLRLLEFLCSEGTLWPLRGGRLSATRGNPGYAPSRNRRPLPARLAFDELAPLGGFSVVIGCFVAEIPFSAFSRARGKPMTKKRSAE